MTDKTNHEIGAGSDPWEIVLHLLEVHPDQWAVNAANIVHRPSRISITVPDSPKCCEFDIAGTPMASKEMSNKLRGAILQLTAENMMRIARQELLDPPDKPDIRSLKGKLKTYEDLLSQKSPIQQGPPPFSPYGEIINPTVHPSIDRHRWDQWRYAEEARRSKVEPKITNDTYVQKLIESSMESEDDSGSSG